MKPKPLTPREFLSNELISFCSNAGYTSLEDDILADIPRKWQKFDDFVLITSGFRLPFWRQFDDNDYFWSAVATGLRGKRVAVAGRIESDNFRTPKIDIKFGLELGTVIRHLEQGIVYTWDCTKSMFSQGNTTEKARIARLPCSGETVVDLYAGIGYFTLPYLVKAKASHVIACEWNSTAVAFLRRNLVENHISPERCTILEGDNRMTCPSGVANRVNLGLIPSSHDGWSVACRALKRASEGWLHVHGNVTDKSKSRDREDFNFSTLSAVTCSKCVCRPAWSDWAAEVGREIFELLNETGDGVAWNVTVRHIEHVKSYAPHIDHLVVDLLCVPSSL